MYSQNLEDEIILDYFRDTPNGKFIDIGAFHVFQFSNTRALYETLNWSGVLVEPAPTQFNAIYEHYKDEPRIITLNMAVGETNGEIDFYESLDAVSTSDVAHMTKWKNAGVPFNKIKVTQIKTKDFFDEYCHGVDFLSVDTEATNYAVFNEIPDFVFNQIKMLCIEHDLKHEEMEDRLAGFGFYKLHFNGENIIFAR